jgi:prophage antirepressor-like protein
MNASSQTPIQPFDFNGHLVRTTAIQDDVWFVTRDVCEILEIQDTHVALRRIDEDDRYSIPVIDALGRAQDTSIISESGFYTLVLSSRKKIAKPFRRWVTREVLPSIRKTGQYRVHNQPTQEEEALRVELSLLRAEIMRLTHVLDATPLPVKRAPKRPGGQQQIPWMNRVQPCLKNPGTWQVVFTSSSDSAGKATKHCLENGKRRIPAGQWEFAFKYLDSGGSATLARYLGEKEAA